MLAKIYIGTLAALIWVAAVVGKHFWTDLDTSAIVAGCASVLAGLGVFHVSTPEDPAAPAAAAPDKAQGGFASIALLILVAAGALLLSGCGSMTGQFQNRITTTLDCTRGFVASLYGPIGVTAEIDAADVAYLPCHLKK